jgi:hypothetical protein
VKRFVSCWIRGMLLWGFSRSSCISAFTIVPQLAPGTCKHLSRRVSRLRPYLPALSDYHLGHHVCLLPSTFWGGPVEAKSCSFLTHSVLKMFMKNVVVSTTPLPTAYHSTFLDRSLLTRLRAKRSVE